MKILWEKGTKIIKEKLLHPIKNRKELIKNREELIWDDFVFGWAKKNLLERIPVVGKPISKAGSRLFNVKYKEGMPNTEEYLKLLKNYEKTKRIGVEYGLELGNKLNKPAEAR